MRAAVITRNHFQTDTPWFRLALSLAALWLLWTGYQAVSAYNARGQAPEAVSEDDERYLGCLPLYTDVEHPENNPTPYEIAKCRKGIDDIYAAIEVRRSWWDKRWSERQAIKQFARDGLLPAGIALLIVALWGQIAAMGRRYMGWLKHGRAPAEGQD